MIDTDDFIKRLEYLMEYHSLNASTFADKIGVQRSGISHLLSGRNKPSLDFVMKITGEFPEVNLYWLLEGKESFLKEITTAPAIQTSGTVERKNTEPMENHVKNDPVNILPHQKTPGTAETPDIYRVIIFYTNGTFKDFNSSNA